MTKEDLGYGTLGVFWSSFILICLMVLREIITTKEITFVLITMAIVFPIGAFIVSTYITYTFLAIMKSDRMELEELEELGFEEN